MGTLPQTKEAKPVLRSAYENSNAYSNDSRHVFSYTSSVRPQLVYPNSVGLTSSLVCFIH